MQASKKVLISEAWVNCSDGNIYINEHSSYGDFIYQYIPYEYIFSFDINVVKNLSYTCADTKKTIVDSLNLDYLNKDLSNNIIFNKIPSVIMLCELLHSIVMLGFNNEKLILPFTGLLQMQLNLNTCKLIESTPCEVSVQYFNKVEGTK